jgi:hypothetical protein
MTHMGKRNSKGMERVANGQDLFNGHMHSIKFGTVSQSLNGSPSLANPKNWGATNKNNDTQDRMMRFPVVSMVCIDDNSNLQPGTLCSW